MRSMLERIMLDIMYEVPSREDIAEVTINRDDGLKSVCPMPRMYATSALPNEEFAGRSETFGAFAVIWNRFVWLRASSISALTAVIAIGVS